MKLNVEIIKISPIATDEIDYNKLIFKVEFPKKVDLNNVNDLWIHLKSIVDGGALKVMVNMINLEFINSSGIATLINAAKSIRKNKGDIVLYSVPQEIRNIFKIVNLQDFIKIYGTEGEAFNFFRFV